MWCGVLLTDFVWMFVSRIGGGPGPTSLCGVSSFLPGWWVLHDWAVYGGVRLTGAVFLRTWDGRAQSAGLRAGVRIQLGRKICFSYSKSGGKASTAPQPSALFNANLIYFCGLKWPVYEDVHSRLSSIEVNPLTPNDHYRGRTAPLTSKRCILYIYSTNIGTEYFKNGIYSPFFPL